MVLKGLSLVITLLLFSGQSLYDLNKKRVDKALVQSFGDQEIVLSEIEINALAKADVYTIVDPSSNLIGYAIINVAPSKVDTFTYMTLFEPDGAIRNVTILVYRENYGGEIASKRFLRQYVGKKAGENMEYSKDIDGISGATLSVRSLNHALNQDSKQLYSYINETK